MGTARPLREPAKQARRAAEHGGSVPLRCLRSAERGLLLVQVELSSLQNSARLAEALDLLRTSLLALVIVLEKEVALAVQRGELRVDALDLLVVALLHVRLDVNLLVHARLRLLAARNLLLLLLDGLLRLLRQLVEVRLGLFLIVLQLRQLELEVVLHLVHERHDEMK